MLAELLEKTKRTCSQEDCLRLLELAGYRSMTRMTESFMAVIPAFLASSNSSIAGET